MRVNEKTIAFRIHPYIQEAEVQILVDIFVITLVFVLFTWIGASLVVPIVIILFYFFLALALHYRVVILAIIDKRKRDYITETVSIKKFADEFSFAGDRFGNSYVRLFYPRDMQVQRQKIIVISHDGKKKKLRSVMSSSRLLKFILLDREQQDHMQVAYLRRSKILLCVELGEELNKTVKRKRRQAIEKAIRSINSSI